MPEGLVLFTRIGELLGKLDSQVAWDEFSKLPGFEQLRDTSPATAESMHEQFTQPLAKERQARLERMPNDHPIDGWNQVSRLEMPALVVGNQLDPMHPFAMATEWAKRLPNARLEQIPSKSESLDCHTEVFRRHLVSYLEALRGYR